jgi:hypothetical protein
MVNPTERESRSGAGTPDPAAFANAGAATTFASAAAAHPPPVVAAALAAFDKPPPPYPASVFGASAAGVPDSAAFTAAATAAQFAAAAAAPPLAAFAAAAAAPPLAAFAKPPPPHHPSVIGAHQSFVGPKCCRRGCRGKADELPLPCQGSGCVKYLHLSCFKEKYGNTTVPNLGEGQVICTKACQKKIIASSSSGRLFWNNDGADGPGDPLTSERILLDWLLVPDNYALKWRGKDNGGVRKKQLAMKIAEKMNDSNVKVRRDGRQVLSKIRHLEDAFKKAHDWSNTETGAGLQEKDKRSFDQALLHKCPFYFDLLPVFGDRASAKPSATSNEDLSSSLGSDDEDYQHGQDALDDLSDESEESIMPGDGEGTATTGIATSVAKGVRRQSTSSAPSIASKKTRTSIPPHKHVDDLSHLAAMKAQFTAEKLRQLKQSEKLREEEFSIHLQESSIKLQQSRIELRVFKMNQLRQMRHDNPDMTDEQIVQLFPEFADIIHIV